MVPAGSILLNHLLNEQCLYTMFTNSHNDQYTVRYPDELHQCTYVYQKPRVRLFHEVLTIPLQNRYFLTTPKYNYSFMPPPSL